MEKGKRNSEGKLHTVGLGAGFAQGGKRVY